MAMLLVLVDAAGEQPDVNPERLHELSSLGVTDLAILHGETTTAVLVEGWALNPAHSAARVSRIVAGDDNAPVLLPILQASVTPVQR